MKNRTLLIVIGIVAGLCLMSVVAVAVLFRVAGQSLKNSVKSEPAEAAEVGASIAEYTLPEGYAHQMSMSLMNYDFVFIGPEDGSGELLIMLGQYGGIEPSASEEELFKQQMQRSLEQQSGRRGTTMKVVEVKQMTIRGKQVDVTISEGQVGDGVNMRQLVATFPANSGLGMVMITGTTDEWDQEAVDEFLASIR